MTPEMWTALFICVLAVAGVIGLCIKAMWETDKQSDRYRAALNEIYWNSGDDAAKQIARKALEE